MPAREGSTALAVERRLDAYPRRVVPTARIPAVADRIETGDIVDFATSIEGLDVSHAAFAYRTGDGVLRVLHAPLSGGEVEVTAATLHGDVAAIDRPRASWSRGRSGSNVAVAMEAVIHP